MHDISRKEKEESEDFWEEKQRRMTFGIGMELGKALWERWAVNLRTKVNPEADVVSQEVRWVIR